MDTLVVGTASTSSGWTGSTSGLALFPFTGSIDEPAYYPQPLTQAQIFAHYTARTAGNRLTTITEPGPFTATTIGYDSLTGRVATITDRNGEAWTIGTPSTTNGIRSVSLSSADTSPITYAYDEANGGRLVSRADGLGTTSYQYNAAGFMTQVTDPNGNVTAMQTDALGNPLAVTTCRAT